MAAEGWNVHVYTSDRGYDDPSRKYALFENRHGVRVIRLPFSSFGKSSMRMRLFGQVMFAIQAVARCAFLRRVDRILVSTVPPFSNFSGLILSWILRAPLVWWVMDLNPDQLIRVRSADPKSLFVRLLDWLNRVTLRRASSTVTLDDYMRERLLAKEKPSGTLHVIPPWSHGEKGERAFHVGNPFRAKHGLDGKCIVMYSGNHGLTNPLGTVVAAAKELRTHPTLSFLFVGGGRHKPAIDDAIRAFNLTNVLSLPYQPLEDLKYSLTAPDVHVVSISHEAVGVSHSCKIYGAMNAGRPIIALGPKQSHIGTLIHDYKCGWVHEHEDIAGLVKLLEWIALMPSVELNEIGERGAHAVEKFYNPDRLIAKVCSVISSA
jgi:colanic acid biosynthesis glycosyl transferase WcaI